MFLVLVYHLLFILILLETFKICFMGAAEFGTEDVFLTKEKVWFSQNEQDFRFI